MTDRIDLDELDVDDSPESDVEQPNYGDWFWKGEGDPDDEPERTTRTASSELADGPVPDTETVETGADTREREQETGRERQPIPHVPRANKDKPIGLPIEQGGAGGGPAKDDDESTPAGSTASGPHGGGIDDMTLAITYEAARQLADPGLAFADASEWADWIGIVGHVEAHIINKFQRDALIDLDFFNGTGTGPGERLAEIDEHSMFFAQRMVVVGTEGEEEIAEAADWEFVPLAEAVAKADWALAE